MNEPISKRTMLVIASALDALLSGIVLLIYFGLVPVDISAWGIPRWTVGLAGGIWFLVSIGILAWQLTRADISE